MLFSDIVFLLNLLFMLFDHLEKSKASPLMFYTFLTLSYMTELLLSNYWFLCYFFLVRTDFCSFYSLSFSMYSKFLVSLPPQVITALFNSSGNFCSSTGLLLSLMANASTQLVSNLLKWQAEYID